MYQQFFNFSIAPFSIAPDPHFIYMSQQHQEGLAHLLYGINQGGGFVALTGEVGTGKTTLCNCLLNQLPEDIEIALILNPKLSSIELLASICDELHISYEKGAPTLKWLIDKLNIHLLSTHAKNRKTVVLIDEAQNLSLDVLEQIRLLTNLETVKAKLLQIILVGQPELKKILERPELRQLNQRITARYHLTSLSLKETKSYIKHRLNISGGSQEVFKSSAIKKIFKLSNGIPRLINILCDRSLLGAYAIGSQVVTPSIVSKAAKEVLNLSTSSQRVRTKLLFILAAAIFCLIFFFLINQTDEKTTSFTDKVRNIIEKKVLIKKPAIKLPIASKNEEKIKIAPKKEEMKSRSPQLFGDLTKKENIKSVKKNESIKKVSQPSTVNSNRVINSNKEEKAKTHLKEGSMKNRSEQDSISLKNEGSIKTASVAFDSYLKQQKLSLDRGVFQLALLWGKNVTETNGCDELESQGLHCLLGKSNWVNLVALNRPVVLEFSVSETEKTYAVLLGIKDGQPIFQSNSGITFSVEQVLALWKGYYLLLWQPPIKEIKTVFPEHSSKAILWIKKQVTEIQGYSFAGLDYDFYGADLSKEIIKFQKKNNLISDGIVGPKTFIHLQNHDTRDNSPKLKLVD